MPAAPTDISTLSLHDALPISRVLSRILPAERPPHRPELAPRPGRRSHAALHERRDEPVQGRVSRPREAGDRKSTRLNSSHPSISYAVFCLKKKNRPHAVLAYT